MMKFLIADDHAVVRKGLKHILLESFDCERIGEATNGEELVHTAINEEWDAVITDITMPGLSGLEALHQIRHANAKIPVLILSIHPEDQYAVRVLKAGASGYLSKSLSAEELAMAVRQVLQGKKYISPTVAEKLATSLTSEEYAKPHELLSDREFDILKLIATGKSITQIALMLSRSPTTISTYRARILNKLGMRTNAELVHYALEHSLIQWPASHDLFPGGSV